VKLANLQKGSVLGTFYYPIDVLRKSKPVTITGKNERIRRERNSKRGGSALEYRTTIYRRIPRVRVHRTPGQLFEGYFEAALRPKLKSSVDDGHDPKRFFFLTNRKTTLPSAK